MVAERRSFPLEVFGIDPGATRQTTSGGMPSAADTQESIRKAFQRNAGLEADDLLISTLDGSVTVKGAVKSWAERDEAIAAAWAAPGVTSVHDDLTIVY